MWDYMSEHVEKIEDWQPAAPAVMQARNALAEVDGKLMIMVTLQPGKPQGIWPDGGTRVVTLSRMWQVGGGPGMYEHGAAREEAARYAEAELTRRYGGDGTAAFAVVDDDDFIPVFEVAKGRS